jgi:hypothetical protein
MSKKLIIMAAGAGLLSFGAAFAVAWFFQKTDTTQPPGKSAIVDEATTDAAALDLARVRQGISGSASDKRNLTGAQLKSLVYDVREKMLEYDNKLEQLKLREQRLQVAQSVLKQDITKLDNLRVDLASMTAKLREERDKLQKETIRIDQAEKANLISVAATYDKMDPAAASQILTAMSKTVQPSADQSDAIEEPVKILRYMADRTKAKVLAELVASEPKLAAAFCHRLEQVIEENQ